MRKIFTFLTLVAVLALTGCNTSSNMRIVQHHNVCILNQGNYSEGNSSISVYDESTGTITNNAFEKANGYKLGATLMSGGFNSYGVCYLLCANPDKIEVVDIITMKSLAEAITDGLNNPREILVAGSFFFVTNCGDEYIVADDGSWVYTNSYVSIYSAVSNSKLKDIYVGSDAHGMAFKENGLYEGTLYVGTRDGIVAIDCNANGEFKMRDEVYSDEEYTGNVRYLHVSGELVYASVPNKGIYAYNPSNKNTAWRSDIPVDFNGNMSGNDKTIYTYATMYNPDYTIASSDIYALDLSSRNYTKVASGENLYSVGVSPSSGNIFYSEANGFTTNSTMTVISNNGTPVDLETAGVGTFRYLFYSYNTSEEIDKE